MPALFDAAVAQLVERNLAKLRSRVRDSSAAPEFRESVAFPLVVPDTVFGTAR